jgi:hypothetical protein
MAFRSARMWIVWQKWGQIRAKHGRALGLRS